MKSLLQKILKILAKAVLKKYQPEVIGVTGSVGKTGAKEAIYCVLAGKFKARQSIKNYNNEIGLPLTIIGAESSSRSLSSWLKIFFSAFKLLLKRDPNYPKILVLEMAVDRPGDLAYLTNIAPPHIGVITAIGESHLEYFKTLEKIKEEKATLIRRLPKNGWAILNIDNDAVKSVIKETKARVISYAIDSQAEVRAQEIRLKLAATKAPAEELGLSFKLTHQGSFTPVFIPNLISRAGVLACLAAAAVGIVKGLNLVEISQALKRYESPKGRMRFISGIKNSYVIDDTYNSSPASSILALETLHNISLDSGAYKYAVFGDMLELGHLSEPGHQAVGQAVVKDEIDKLIVVGERSRDIARGAKAAGMKDDDIFHFAATAEAGEFLAERIKSGDIVLVKGSQGARMEKIVKRIMAEPARAGELLVRQSGEWQDR